MTNTQRHAVSELNILVKTASTDDRPVIEPFIPEILSLCEKFGLSGQSGGSAPFTATILAKTIKRLCLQEPICPIMGVEEEWMDVTEMNDGSTLYQNKRCSAIFKMGNGSAYYLDAIVFKDKWNEDNCFTGTALDGNRDVIYSRQYINFPFTPKTFYIDVVKKDEEYLIIDTPSLIKAIKYFKKITK